MMPPADAPPASCAACDALALALGDAELGAKLAGDWSKIVLERGPDGRIAIDVDGAQADIDLGGEHDAPAEGDGAAPMPPPAG